MRPLHKLIMALSADYLDVYKYIFSRSMAEKDYATAIARLREILEGVKRGYSLLAKEKGAEDYEVFLNHLRNTAFVVVDTLTVVAGLQAKAERTGRYGLLQYRKDIKARDSSYDNFEYTGNQMNSLAHKYS